MLFLYYPVTGALLGPESLPFLHDELYDIRGKWYDIGVQIGVDVGTLESIKNEYGDGGDALRQVLTHWLKREPTWEPLFKALRSRPVRALTIANTLQRKMAELLPEIIQEGILKLGP